MSKEKRKVITIIVGIIIIAMTTLAKPYIKEYLTKEKNKYGRSILKKEKITSLQEEKDTLVIGLYVDDSSNRDIYVFLIKNGEDYKTARVKETKIEKEDTEPYYIEYQKNAFGENMPKENYKLVLPPKTKIINVNYKQIKSIIKSNKEKHIMGKINNLK